MSKFDGADVGVVQRKREYGERERGKWRCDLPDGVCIRIAGGAKG